MMFDEVIGHQDGIRGVTPRVIRIIVCLQRRGRADQVAHDLGEGRPTCSRHPLAQPEVQGSTTR